MESAPLTVAESLTSVVASPVGKAGGRIQLSSADLSKWLDVLNFTEIITSEPTNRVCSVDQENNSLPSISPPHSVVWLMQLQQPWKPAQSKRTWIYLTWSFCPGCYMLLAFGATTFTSDFNIRPLSSQGHSFETKVHLCSVAEGH